MFWAIGTGSAIFLIFLFFREMNQEEQTTLETEQETSVLVRAGHPAGVADTLTYEAQGKVTSARSFSVAALSEGRIRTVLVPVNGQVKKGDVIAVLENSEMDSAFTSQSEKLRLSSETEANLKKKVAAGEEMYSLGIIAESDLVSMKQELNNQIREVHDAQIEYDRLKNRRDQYNVMAEVAGYVSSVLPEKSFVTYGQTIAEIVSLDDEQVQAFVPFDQLVQPVPGDEVLISSNSMAVSGKVSHIFPSTGSNLITVNINPDQPIPMNLDVMVTFKVKGVKGFQIPKSAVVLAEGKPVVFLVRDGKAVQEDITILKDYLDTVVITDDFRLDDVLVMENAYLLSDQMNVTVR